MKRKYSPKKNSPNADHNPSHRRRHLILLTGASGYVGGRLLKTLKDRKDIRLRCIARRPEFLKPRTSASTEIVQGDLLHKPSLAAALYGVHTAYYLVHSMGALDSFEQKDRLAAHNFALAAKEAGVHKIVYLGGLANSQEKLSAHLQSRQEVGEILRSSGVPVLELRASIVIGSGSLSFELIRSLVERLPIMLTPKWVSMPAQPISIEDLVHYLTEALDLPLQTSRTLEVGGADCVSYQDIMRLYARKRKRRLVMIRVPALTPRLSSLWLGLITPLYARVGRKLIESVVHSTIVKDQSALRIFKVKPMGVEEAIDRALIHEDNEYAETRWSDALSASGRQDTWGGMRFGTRLVDSRKYSIDIAPSIVFATIEQIGGTTGWYAWNVLWQLRGHLDLLLGGVGMRRGRPHPRTLHVGDPVDFWRVDVNEPGRRLRLRAEMKIPGRAWLEFEVTSTKHGSTIHQIAIFDPVGLLGLLYWYALFPLHHIVFRGMINGIARAAKRTDDAMKNHTIVGHNKHPKS